MTQGDVILLLEKGHKFCYEVLTSKDVTTNHYVTSGKFIDRSSRP